MTFNVSGYVTMDATQAEKALTSTTGKLKKVTAAVKETGTATATSGRGAADLNSQLQSTGAAAGAASTSLQQLLAQTAGIHRETQSASASAAAFKTAIEAEARSFDYLRASIDPVYRASKQYEAAQRTVQSAVRSGAATQTEANRVLAIAEAQYLATGQATGQMGRQHAGAAGSMGNLMAQFNDIGVMMAAGQNPLQLALQQGTQITQVIGPMGAAGAVKALGGALLGMINPISLITIGSIAAGAAMFQWLTQTGDKVVSFEEHLDGARQMLDRYSAASEKARIPTAELSQKFGDGAQAARSYYQELARIEGRNLVGSAGSLIVGLTQDYEEARDLFDLSSMRIKGRSAAAGQAELSQLAAAAQGLDEQIATTERLYENSVRLADLHNGRSAEEDIYIQKLAQSLLILREQEGAQEAAAREAQAKTNSHEARIAALRQEQEISSLMTQYGNDAAIVEQRRLEIERQKLQVKLEQRVADGDLSQEQARAEAAAFAAAQQADYTAKIAEQARQINAEQAKHQATAQGMLATLTEENAIQAAILRHGESSVQVTELRAAAARRALSEILANLSATEDLKEQIRAALETAQDLAATDVGAGIRGAVSAAQALSAELGVSLGIAQALADARHVAERSGGVNNNGLDAQDPRNPNNTRATEWTGGHGRVSPFDPSRNRPKPRSRSGAGRGSGGVSDLERQREATQNLITSLKEELEILRETDPLQKELLRNREALAAATASERVEITSLIAQRIAETNAIEQQRDQWNFLRSAAGSALSSLTSGAESFGDAMKKVAANILDAAIQAAVFGDGPLSSLFGGGAGVFGMIFPASVAATKTSTAQGAASPIKFAGAATFMPAAIELPRPANKGTVPVQAATAEPVKSAGAATFVPTPVDLPRPANNDIAPAQAATAEPVKSAGAATFAPAPVDLPRPLTVIQPLAQARPAPPPALRLAASDGAPVAPARDAGSEPSRAPMQVTIDLRGTQGDAAVEAKALAGMRRALEEYDQEVLPLRVGEIADKPWRSN